MPPNSRPDKGLSNHLQNAAPGMALATETAAVSWAGTAACVALVRKIAIRSQQSGATLSALAS